MEISELVKRLKEQEAKGVLRKDSRYANWSQEHMNKADFDLLSARIEYLLLTDENVRRSSELFSKYNRFDWLTIKSYYAMYHSVLALLAELGFKTETHFATIAAFELFFIRRNRLVEEKFLDMLVKVMERVGTMPYDYAKMFMQARRARHIAQYDVTSSVVGNEAEDSFEKAIEFIEEMKTVYGRLKEIKKSSDFTGE